MIVSEIMQKDIYSVKPDDKLTSVAGVICRKKISGMCVIDESGKLVGIISEKDLLRTMYPSYEEFYSDPVSNIDFQKMEDRYEDIYNKRVDEVMTTNLSTASPDTPVLKVASLMIVRKIRRVPIIEGNKVVGIVTQGDIHQAIFRKECAIY